MATAKQPDGAVVTARLIAWAVMVLAAAVWMQLTFRDLHHYFPAAPAIAFGPAFTFSLTISLLANLIRGRQFDNR